MKTTSILLLLIFASASGMVASQTTQLPIMGSPNTPVVAMRGVRLGTLMVAAVCWLFMGPGQASSHVITNVMAVATLGNVAMARSLRRRRQKHSSQYQGQICATKPHTPEDRIAVLDHEKQWLSKKKGGGVKSSPVSTFNIIFNVLTTQSGQFDIPTPIILKQMQILNTAYAGGDTDNGFSGHTDTNVRWRLVGINRYVTSMAGKCGDEGPIDAAISSAYRVPGNVFNVYTCNLRGNLLGYTFMPCGSSGRQMYLKWNTMSPIAGQKYPFNLGFDGDTLTHECGHFLGLEHTFQGGCTEPNDSVADTPEEATPYFGACPPGSKALQRNTCTAPGFDPIQNFMEYVTTPPTPTTTKH